MLDKKTKIKICGQMQKIHIISRDEKLPVLLFLHGGPGGINRHDVMVNHLDLLDTFTMVGWDQRGSGGSAKGTDYSKMTVDVMIEDAACLVERLCKMFGKDKIFIACLSWGSVLGTLLVQKHPEHIAAYVGYGQFVNGDLNEKLGLEWIIEQAEKAGNKEDVKELKKLGVPQNGQYKGGLDAIHTQRKYLNKYGGYSPNNHDSNYGGNDKLKKMKESPEYSAADWKGYVDGHEKTTGALWPEVGKIDFVRSCTKVDVPFYFFDGHQDMNTPWPLVEEWYEKLEAPDKCLIWFEDSGHNPLTDEPEKFKKLLREKLTAIAEKSDAKI